jgi:taurine dioxygenase
MDLIPLSPALGVEVRGVLPEEKLRPSTIESLKSALDEFHLLLFRGRPIVAEDQIALSEALLGPVNDHRGQRSFLFTNRANLAENGTAGRLLCHSDLTFMEEPQTGLSNYGLEIPSSGTSTLYVNAELAWQTLSEPLRERISGRSATHVHIPPIDVPARRNSGEIIRCASHPMVFTHPRTGRQVLFVTDLATQEISGLPAAESLELLDLLCAHLESPEHCYEHEWQVDDLVIWDNISLQHGRNDEASSGVRTLRKVEHGANSFYN